jgi:hypothetical protein
VRYLTAVLRKLANGWHESRLEELLPAAGSCSMVAAAPTDPRCQNSPFAERSETKA